MKLIVAGTNRAMTHSDEADRLWDTYVPQRGQAETQQGEMIRAVERLSSEAYRNGYQNFDEHFERLGTYLKRNLLAHDGFSDDARREIEADMALVLDAEHPPEEEVFDRLRDRVVEWARAHPDPIPHEHDPELGI